MGFWVCFCIFLFFGLPHGMGILSPHPGVEPVLRAVEVQSYPLDCWGSSPKCPFLCVLPLCLTYSISFIFFYIVSNYLPPDTYKLKCKLVILE